MSVDINNKLLAALDYHTSGKLEEAGELYKEILTVDPGNAEVYYLLGVVYGSLGNIEPAILFLEKAISLNPYYEYYCVLGNIYFDKGDIDTAISCYLKSIELKPNHFEAYNNLGMAYTNKKMLTEAINCYAKAIDLNANCAEIYNNLGTVLFEIEELENAIKCHEKAIEIKPDYALAYFNLGNDYKEKGNIKGSIKNPEYIDKAFISYIKAIELMPDFAEAYVNLGQIYYFKNNLVEEMNCYEKALKLAHNSAQIYNNIGNINKDLGRIEEAIKYFEKAIELDPDFGDSHCNLIICYLTVKNFEKAWEHYDWRLFDNAEYRNRLFNIKQPLWKGDSLDGKTIYIYYEQGLGDTINFARYLNRFNSMGAKVRFKPQKELESLFRENCFGTELISNATPDNTLSFDTHNSVMSLPCVLKTTKENIPNFGKYITANPEKVKFYKEKYFDNDDFKLGIIWQCKNFFVQDFHRSIPHLSCFYPFTQIDGVKVYSFQKGPGIEQLDSQPEENKIVDLGNTFEDFSDTAAALENIDLLISVDTSVPHLAGAMDKPVWLLLQFVPDWRWSLEGSTTPWYNSFKLFRQKQIGDWQEVIDRVYQEFNTKFFT